MKKIVIKIVVLFLIFVFGVAGFSSLMNNQTTDNKTDLETAMIPCMAMKIGDMEVNRMYGYAQDMQTDFMRDSLTPIGTDKTLNVSIAPNGCTIESMVYEIRTSDGSKVIENNRIRSFQEEADGKKTAVFTLQNSILMNQEYSLILTLNTEKGSWHYYTRILQRAGLSTDKYVEFVNSFYTKTFTKESRGDLATYLESDSSAGNNSFSDLNIHSSLDMVTWGSLAPELSRQGIPTIKDINENTGSVSITYYITAENENGEVERYQVDEFYRMRYDQTRVRLLDFERSAKQVLTTEQTVVTNGRLNLGVTDRNVQYQSDTEGNIIAFVQQGDLWSYNVESNKLVRVFSFRDTGSNDERNDYDQHDIEIVRVEESGDIDFILYGYMNRGEHEGRVGTAVYHYSAEQNVIQEEFFLSSEKSFEFLKQDIQKLAYVSPTGNLYLLLEGTLYELHMEDKSYQAIQENMTEECFRVSDNGKYIAWMEGMDPNNTTSIICMDLENTEQQKLQAGEGQKLRLFGFINEDVIYGIANDGDILQNTFAMHEIRIQNHEGELVKSYHQDGYYVVDVESGDNLLELKRVQKQENGYVEANSDQIMNNVKSKQDEAFARFTNTTVRQAGITGIQFTQIGTFKEALVVEAKFTEILEDHVLSMKGQEKEEEAYYVYAQGGLWGIYEGAAQAVQQADEQAGVVLNRAQQYIWERGNSKDKAGINLEDIPDPIKSGEADLAKLNEALKGMGSVVNMSGCTMDQILYEVSVQRPVITRIEGGQVRVLVGYDGYNTQLYDPATQQTSYFGRQESQRAFEAGGNTFLCYLEEL